MDPIFSKNKGLRARKRSPDALNMMHPPKLGIRYGGVFGHNAPKMHLLAFLSNQEVLGCHKNIYRELRPSLTSFEILGNIIMLPFRQQKQHLLTKRWLETPMGSPVENLGKGDF